MEIPNTHQSHICFAAEFLVSSLNYLWDSFRAETIDPVVDQVHNLLLAVQISATE